MDDENCTSRHRRKRTACDESVPQLRLVIDVDANDLGSSYRLSKRACYSCAGSCQVTVLAGRAGISRQVVAGRKYFQRHLLADPAYADPRYFHHLFLLA